MQTVGQVEDGMSETYRKDIVQHIVRNLLDIKLLRIIDANPTWGYRIKKQIESEFNIKLRHGALYPALNSLEKKGFIVGKKQKKDGRACKVYSITTAGRDYLRTYFSILQGQIDGSASTS